MERFIKKRQAGLGFQPGLLAKGQVPSGEGSRAPLAFSRLLRKCLWGRPQALGAYCSTSRSKSFSFNVNWGCRGRGGGRAEREKRENL